MRFAQNWKIRAGAFTPGLCDRAMFNPRTISEPRSDILTCVLMSDRYYSRTPEESTHMSAETRGPDQPVLIQIK